MEILFYPEKLEPNNKKSRISRIISEVKDIKVHNDPNKYHDLHIFWSFTRHSIKPDKITLGYPNIINRGCWDISKIKVNNIFNDISIDPTEYIGECVEKYDRQGMHNFHKIVNCPTLKKPDYIYQKYIKTIENGLYVRYRVSYAGEITYIRKIYQKHPFETNVIKDELVPIRNIFSEEQEIDFNNKCKIFGFDLGDVDVLIDNGNPVVIDINNVVGPASVLPNKDNYNKIDKAIVKYLYKMANIPFKEIDFYLK
ncbi:MAG: hypothetical protein WDA02_06105 [Saccharofermentanales bacterium]